MSQATVDYFAKYDRIMFTVTGQLYDRVFGQNTLHVPVDEVYGYWEQVKREKPEQVDDVIVEVNQPRVLEFQVKGYVLGKDLAMDFRVWGLKGGRNTVFTRVGWWKLRLLERARALSLRLFARAPRSAGVLSGQS